MNTEFTIRKARPADLPEVLPIYEHAKKVMRDTGNPTQWGTVWPPQEVIEADLASGDSYVVMWNDRIACIFFCAVMDEPIYRNIEGRWLNDEPYAVIHRVASSGICKGAAGFALNWAVQNFLNVRIDTHECNKVMRHLLEDKLLFSRRGTGTMQDGSPRIVYQKKLLKIPAEWTEIPAEAFLERKDFSAVVIPGHIKKIGKSAFEHCWGLRELILMQGLTEIGANAFHFCQNLVSLTIPDSVTVIGDSAFEDCDSLTSVIIPDSVTELGTWAFEDCSDLTSLKISKGVTVIPENAFSWDEELLRVTIPDSVHTIKFRAFDFCTGLKDVVIPESVTEIEEAAFSSCRSLTSVIIPPRMKKIPWRLFEKCSSLTEAVIPDSVKLIEPQAFLNCTKLTKLTLPDSEDLKIAPDAFSGCSALPAETRNLIKRHIENDKN